ncbi:two-component regulator propeller domain-containing protein [Mucilaginibacter flavus]|uniref:two-component regulator propeller domain-containing protein n=1 Tax=Mucilaginibacter flavus TaxID=931504 RepID=UPI0025B4FAA0|nr:two-component regulator propeller domain-containing protein [Mucilaginibacter flavus]MDN3582568.1 two-component regulator propeller domain-containing protein [Mucilaginibacter flavus]
MIDLFAHLKNSFLKICLLASAICISSLAYAQGPHLYFDHLDVKKGLPESTGRVIKEDNEGYIWIATQNGLVRYDGYECKVYNLGNLNTNTYSSTNVLSLLLDRQGNLWATTISNGIFQYRRETDTFKHIPYPADGKITTFTMDAVDRDNNIWGHIRSVSYGASVVKLNTKSGAFEYFGIKEKGNNFINASLIYEAYASASGKIWLSSNNGIYRYDGTGKPMVGFMTIADTAKQRHVNPIYEAKSEPGVFWLNTFHGYNIDLRITRFDSRDNSIKEYWPSTKPDSALSTAVYSIYEDKNKQLWFATDKGVSKFDRKAHKFTNYTPKDSIKSSDQNQLQSFRETKEGNLWLSFPSGLVYFEPASGRFTRYMTNAGEVGTLSQTRVIAKMVDHANTLWAGFDEAGVNRVNKLKSAFTIYKNIKGNITSYPIVNKIVNNKDYSYVSNNQGIYKLYTATGKLEKLYSPDDGYIFLSKVCIGLNGMLYIGGSNGLYVYNTTTGKKEHYNRNDKDSTTISSSFINNVYQDHEGIIWLGNADERGLCSFNPQTKKITRYPYHIFSAGGAGNILNDGKILAIFEDKEGTLWIGTNNGGLNRFDRKTQKFTSYFDTHNRTAFCVDDIFQDSAGRLWVGTYLNGVYIFDKEKGAFTHHFSESNGLLFNSNMGINEDAAGRIWVLTERGLSRIDPKNFTIHNFSVESFLPGNDVTRNLSSLYKLSDGKLAFMVSNGLAAFNPKDLDDSPYEPVVHIESLTYNDPLADSKTANRIVTFGRKSVELKYNENRVEFNYIGLQFDDPLKNTYAYKLDGYDKNWIQAGTQRSVTYTNLPAGTYTFKVKAANSDGVWNNIGDSIQIVILSPWWARWWAWLIYIVVFAFVIYSYINYRQRHLREENQLLEERINERTLELSDANKALSEQSEEITAQRDQLADTVNELKSTQQQLIQSEKLASLGELTAGIAHEIQNPLNFVNNFSEVSIELAAEMREELAAGNTEDGLAIADDIEQNLQKIMHHGKRADAIVKNMLQHSRNNSGDKQPTNINALADEYLRLAYHGLRAKEKTFNATLNTSFDDNLPPVTIIPQDIGRVLLNMFNNGFYALQQKQKSAGVDYKPTLTLSTLKKDNAVEIIVKDNGTGIPTQIKDKIMQPFFTTKPTGEGTGLGLSLSYDIIVKGHGGKIEVITQEGEGTEFIISLPLGN